MNQNVKRGLQSGGGMGRQPRAQRDQTESTPGVLHSQRQRSPQGGGHVLRTVPPTGRAAVVGRADGRTFMHIFIFQLSFCSFNFAPFLLPLPFSPAFRTGEGRLVGGKGLRAAARSPAALPGNVSTQETPLGIWLLRYPSAQEPLRVGVHRADIRHDIRYTF